MEEKKIQYPIMLLNISDFNNEWNKSVLAMARREREAYWEARRIAESQKPKGFWATLGKILGISSR